MTFELSVAVSSVSEPVLAVVGAPESGDVGALGVEVDGVEVFGVVVFGVDVVGLDGAVGVGVGVGLVGAGAGVANETVELPSVVPPPSLPSLFSRRDA